APRPGREADLYSPPPALRRFPLTEVQSHPVPPPGTVALANYPHATRMVAAPAHVEERGGKRIDAGLLPVHTNTVEQLGEPVALVVHERRDRRELKVRGEADQVVADVRCVRGGGARLCRVRAAAEWHAAREVVPGEAEAEQGGVSGDGRRARRTHTPRPRERRNVGARAV